VSDLITLWLHVLSLAVYFGATFAVAAMVVPLANREADAVGRRRLLTRVLRVYNPLVIAALGILVMTGAFSLTSYKDAMRASFFAELGSLLIWKLALSFLLIMAATYSVFGLGHRLVRFEQWEEPVDAAKEAGIVRRLRWALWSALLLAAATAMVGLLLGHPGMRPVTQGTPPQQSNANAGVPPQSC
jgi:uncharacterized membrane protein